MTVFLFSLATIVGVSFAFYAPPSYLPAKDTKLKAAQWSVDDDWSQLSEVENIVHRPEIGEDLAGRAADSIYQPMWELSDEDQHISDLIEEVNNEIFDSQTIPEAIYDTEWDDNSQMTLEDEMAQEISMLVRCNHSPKELLIEGGRALPPLTDEERDDVSQLATLKDGIWEPTQFFFHAIGAIFREHTIKDDVMKAPHVASWMSKSLNEHVGPHDKRILLTVARYSEYGTGHLTKANFEGLYVQAIQNALDRNQMRNTKGQPTVESIWNDIRNHNILSPVETEREFKMLEMKSKSGGYSESVPSWNKSNEIMDECEISELGETYATTTFQTPEYKDKELTSHELVEMSMDGKTPLYLSDGDFIFIDEESCIGCKQCANVCPSSFLMLDNGRARSFQQENIDDVKAAVESCPVSCMHRVSFDELKTLETVREHGDGRTDHRHLGPAGKNTPLHVAGIDSDANHKSSWYHYIKQKCYMSQECPKKGCYDCPNYSHSGDNPHWKQRDIMSQHMRAATFIELGVADKFRKTAEL